MTPPLLLSLVSDLFFTVKIENAARALGYAVRWIERADQIAPAGGEPARQLAEPLEGQAAAFVNLLVEAQPALIIVDLNLQSLPWEQWIVAAKTSPATRRMPLIAFGAHMDVETQTRAKSAGADAVFAKSRFVEALPELIEKHARRVDRAAIAAACEGEVSELALKGMELFNRGEYFEAHEELEHAWNAEPGPARELYRAVLQIAVAFLHITRGNYPGALKMFLRSRQWIDPLPDECRGVNVAALRAQAREARAVLEALGPDRMAEFPRELLRPVRLRPGGGTASQ